MSFLIPLSICLSSSIVNFKNGPEYLTSGAVQVFIPLMRFILYSLVSSRILVFLRYSVIIIIIIIIIPWEFFQISVSWQSFAEVWEIASLLKSPGLFSVFCPISIMLSFGWSSLFLSFPSPLVPLLILWWLYQEHLL